MTVQRSINMSDKSNKKIRKPANVEHSNTALKNAVFGTGSQ